MASPFKFGKNVILRGRIRGIKFAKYDINYCYFTLDCEDDVGVRATVPCRIEGLDDVGIFRKQGITNGEYILIAGAINSADHNLGRSYWVDIELVLSSGFKPNKRNRPVDYRLAKNNHWFKALNNRLLDRKNGIGDQTNVSIPN